MKIESKQKKICSLILLFFTPNLLYSLENYITPDTTNKTEKKPIRLDINSYNTLLEIHACSAKTSKTNDLPIDFFSEEQKKMQLQQYSKAIQESELKTLEYRKWIKNGASTLDFTKMSTSLLIALSAFADAHPHGRAVKAVGALVLNYGFDKTKEKFVSVLTKFKDQSEKNTAYLILKQKNDEINAFYSKYKNNSQAMQDNLEELVSYIHPIIQDAGGENNTTSSEKRIESLNFKSRVVALSVLELKKKLDKKEIQITQLEKEILKNNNSTLSLKESIHIQDKFQELEEKLHNSVNLFKDFQLVQIQKINIVSQKMLEISKEIDQFKNSKISSAKNLTQEYTHLAQLKNQLEQAAILSAGTDLSDKNFLEILDQASHGKLDENDLKKLLDDENLKKTLTNLGETIQIASEITNLATQTNVMSRVTAIKVQGALKAASGIHQIAVAAAASSLTGGILGAISIAGGLFSLFAPQKDQGDLLAEAFKGLFENQQKMMIEIQNLRELTFRLHIQTQEYLHTEFNYIKENLNLIKSDTNYIVDKITFESCEIFLQSLEELESFSIDQKIEHLNTSNYSFGTWKKYADCTDALYRLSIVRDSKYYLEDIARPERIHSTNESRDNEESITKRNNNIIHLLKFAEKNSIHFGSNKDLTLKKLLRLMTIQKYNYQDIKKSLEELETNYDHIIPIKQEMLSFVENAKINSKLLQKITGIIETLSPWAFGLRSTENSLYFIKNNEINDLINKVTTNEKKIEEMAPFMKRLSFIASSFKNVADSAMIQQNLLDGHLLISFAWNIIENDLNLTTESKTNADGNPFEKLHSDEFESIKSTILKNPTLLANTFRWGLYKAFYKLSKEERKNFAANYDSFLKNQKSSLMRNLISKLLIRDESSNLNHLNYEVQIFNSKETQLAFELQFYTNKLNEINKKPNKDKKSTTEELRELENKRICIEKIEKIKKIFDEKTINFETLYSMEEAQQEPSLYIKIPGIPDVIKLPNTEDLLHGKFNQTNQLLIEPQEKATLLDLNYKSIEKM